MSKTINISEEKFKRVLREIVTKEAAMNGPNPTNQNPFDVENHDEAITGEPVDRAMYKPDDNIDIANPEM